MKTVRFALTAVLVVSVQHAGLSQIVPDRPFVLSSTYWGTAQAEGYAAVAVDVDGNAYVASASSDVTLTKYNAGGAVVYTAHYGNNTFSTVTGIAVDPGGNAVITGYTFSPDLPTLNPIQAAFTPGGCGEFGGTCADAFVARFGPLGTLNFASYLGTPADDRGSDVAVDPAGNMYVIGTSEAQFANAIAIRPHAGNTDAFVVKIPPAGRRFSYVTYLGGSFFDRGNGIDVDRFGAAYITGVAGSSNFPTLNPFQATEQNFSDSAFAAKLGPGGTLVYSTRLGGIGQDAGYDVAVDSLGRATVVGVTRSTNFPLKNPSQFFLRGFDDAFVTRFSPSGSTIEFSTYLGGAERELPFFDFTPSMKIALDGRGGTYVTGVTLSPDFPAVYPLQQFGGGQCVVLPFFDVEPCPDAFVTKFDAAGRIVFSSPIGGSRDDRGRGIAARQDGLVIVTGTTNSTDFPLRNPMQPGLAGSTDAFITRIATGPSVCQLSAPLPLSPSGGLADAQPAFSWQPVAGAEAYSVIALDIADVLRTGTPPIHQLGTTAATSLVPPTPFANGDYTWQVAAWNRFCGFSRFSSPVPFTLPGTCPAPVPTLVSPIDGAAANNPVRFEWTLPGASVATVSIVVVLLPDGRFVTKQPSFGTTLTLPETETLTPGTYTWFVITWNSTCGLSVSAPATMTGTGMTQQ
jgi:hypothetical protein